MLFLHNDTFITEMIRSTPVFLVLQSNAVMLLVVVLCAFFFFLKGEGGQAVSPSLL